jgi:hypothetical protein
LTLELLPGSAQNLQSFGNLRRIARALETDESSDSAHFRLGVVRCLGADGRGRSQQKGAPQRLAKVWDHNSPRCPQPGVLKHGRGLPATLRFQARH